MTKLQISNLKARFALLLLAQLVFVPSARAQAPLAVPVEGQPFRAELTAVAADWQITFAARQQRRTLPAADLVCWGQCAEHAGTGCIVLADGGLLAAKIVAADKNRLTADSNLFGTVELPLESLAGIVFHPPSDRQKRDKLLDRLVQLAGRSDRLLLDNGDELSGLLDGVAGNAVKLETDLGPVEVKTDRATALIFNPARRSKPATKANSLWAWVGFSDGSRLLATRLLVEGKSAKITVAGKTLAVPRKEIVFLQPLGGRAVYLSDLKPTAYRQTPYLALSWPYQADRNVTGGFLRCGGRLYLKGLGVHGAARLEYTLDRKNSPLPDRFAVPGEGQGVRAKRFEAELGIDDSTGNCGSVRFRVLVDGQERFASPIIRGGDPPVPVSVEVAGAKKLELVVDYADRADVLDHADWLNARLVE